MARWKPGDDREQCLVEDRELGAHLVERRRHDRADVAGVPQQADLLAQAAAEVGVLVRGHERVVEQVEQAPDPAERHEQRAAAGLGGVRGEHRVDDEPADERRDGRRDRGPGTRRAMASPTESSIGPPRALRARVRRTRIRCRSSARLTSWK